MTRTKVLFEAYHLYHLPQYMPLYRLLRQEGEYDLFVTCASSLPRAEKELCLQAFRHEGMQVVMAPTEEARFAALDAHRFDIVFVGWGRKGYVEYLRGRDGPVVIMIYHGIGVKASYYKDNNPRIDFRLAESPYRLRQLKRHHVPAYPLLTGFLKLDPLLAPAPFDRAGLLRSLGFDPDRPTVLYAPTFYPSSIGRLVPHLAEATQGYTCIIKLHNYTWHKKRFRDDLRLVQAEASRHPHLLLTGPEWYDALPLMQAADLLVSDASSIVFEYLCLDRPIVVARCYKLLLRHRIFRFFFRMTRIDTATYRQRGFYTTVTRPSQLRARIAEAIAAPGRLADRRRRAREELLFFTDGNSARRAREHVRRIVSSFSRSRQGAVP